MDRSLAIYLKACSISPLTTSFLNKTAFIARAEFRRSAEYSHIKCNHLRNYCYSHKI